MHILDILLFLTILKMYFIRSDKSAILIKFEFHLLLLFIIYINI